MLHARDTNRADCAVGMDSAPVFAQISSDDYRREVQQFGEMNR